MLDISGATDDCSFESLRAEWMFDQRNSKLPEMFGRKNYENLIASLKVEQSHAGGVGNSFSSQFVVIKARK